PTYILEAMLAPQQLANAVGDEEGRLKLLTAAYEYMKREGLTDLQRRDQRQRVIMNSPVPGLAGGATLRGDFSRARELRDEYQRMAMASGTRVDIAESAYGQAHLAHIIGDHTVALPLAEEALALRRETGDRGRIAESA